MSDQRDTCHSHADSDGSLIGELVCHLPYAIFSVAFGLIILSFITFLRAADFSNRAVCGDMHSLFHSFHFLHIVFAATGSVVTFSRFSSNIVKGVFVSLISTLFFCTLSDVILPYVAGRILGVSMHLHICLVSELHNIVPFLLVGLLNGIIMSQHNSGTQQFYSVWAHFGHILASSLASLFYLVSEGFVHWNEQMGALFALLIVAVVVPCTFADVIVPVMFARSGRGE